MARPTLRRPERGPQYPFWIALAAILGLSSVYRRMASEADDPAPPDAGVPAPASAAPAPGSDAAPLDGPTLVWQTEGTRDLPAAPDLSACLAGLTGRTPTLTPVPVADGYATEVTWLGPTIRQRVQASGPGEVPGRMIRTAISDRPHAALAAHLALGACMQPGSTTLVDAALGRRYTPAEWPKPLPGGALDVASLFAQELRDGLLVSHGLARLGLPEVALRPAAGQTMDAARVRLQRAIVAAVVAGRIEDTLTVEGRTVPARPTTLPGLGEIRVLGAEARPAAPPRAAPRPADAPGTTAPPTRAPAPPTGKPLDIDYR
jgi:hypothetical protein